MTRLTTALTAIGILTAGFAVLMAPGAGAASDATPIGFGMESSAINVQKNHGVPADYGTFWLGPWTLSSGWAGPDNQLTTMKNAGVTPAIHFYYWGDDITPSCVENGCWSHLHNSQKDRAGWNQLADQMIQHLNSKMQGEKVVIFMESEFNKGGIETYEPFDGYLSEMNQKIKNGYPNAEIVLSLGSWGRHHWGNFDRSAATSDLVGIQGMRGSTRDSSAHYDDLFETTLDNAQYVKGLFGKPVFIQDLALSSYPEPSYIDRQASELQEFFDNLPALKDAGVMAIVYRSWADSPGMNLANYYGEAERHWGLAWSTSSGLKAAGHVWIDGVKAERNNAAPAPAPSPGPSTGPFSVSFTVPSNVNQYWVEVKATGDGIAKVEASHNGGNFVTLDKNSWGSHSKSFYAPAGTMVFKATSHSGATATSDEMSWLGGSSQPKPTPKPDFTASFTVPSNVNQYWVEVKATGDGIAKVEASHNGGNFVTLDKNSWGSHSKSFYAPAGTMVFKATSHSGATATSDEMSWLGGSSQPKPTPQPAFEATFTAKSAGNQWWVEVDVDSTSKIAKVEAKVDDGRYTTLPATSWGTHAKSIPVPAGSSVTFRATDSSGQTVVSEAVSWGSAAPAFKASFAPKAVGNAYWVEVDVDSASKISKVEVKVDGGRYTTLPATNWDTHAKSVYVAPGAPVVFRATDDAGNTVTSPAVTWSK